MSAIPDTLARYRQPLHNAIEDAVTTFRQQLPEQSTAVNSCIDQLLEYSLRPSKRIRGSLASYIYDNAAKGNLLLEGIKAGAAIELMQNYLLIVDDVMDNSATRRGLPTVHEIYKQNEATTSTREAEMLALLTGLLVQHIAVYTLRNTELSSEKILAASQVLQRHIAITEMGQIDDMRFTASRRNEITEKELLRKYEQKSSYYSFVNPIEVGLLLAGRNAAEAQTDAEAYGIPAGVTFQLRDDWLGIYGDTKATGKPNLDDLREGKYTLMMHEAFKTADKAQVAALENALGNEQAGEVELAQVQNILRDTGAEAATMKLAEEFAETAKQAAQSAKSWDEEVADVLSELVQFSMERVA